MIEQDTPEWHTLKHKRIGGTAARVIWLGGDEYTTEYELWAELTGRAEREWHLGMARGKELEYQARRLYEHQTGIVTYPAVQLAPEAPWAIASLDGRTAPPRDDLLVEFKALARETHEAIATTGVPEPYRIQIMWYLWVTAADACDFVCYHPDCDPALVIIRVHRDDGLIEMLAEKCRGWYERHIVNDEPPARGPRDAIMRDDAPFIEAARLYREEEAIVTEHQAKLDAARELLLSLTNGAMKVEGGGVKVTRYAVAGSLDWSALVKAAKEAGVNVEAFRKEGREQVRVTVTAK